MIVAGFGFRAGAGVASMRDALARAAGGRRVAALATLTDKAAALEPLAREMGVRVIAVGDVAGVGTATRSAASHRARGTGSVAEAVALVAAGRGATLLGMRAVSGDRMATCALAESPGGAPEEGGNEALG